MTLAKPPRYVRTPSFRLVGVADDSFGRRELDDFAVVGEPEDEVPLVVWLGHVRADGAGVRTGTFGRDEAAREAAEAYGRVTAETDPLRLVAWYATDSLVHLTLPDAEAMLAGERPPGLSGRVRNYCLRQAARHFGWARSTLMVDGKPVTAARWSFAGAWAAVADLGDVHLAVVGAGVRPEHVRLATVMGGGGYDVDLTAPLDRERARERPYLRDRVLQTTMLNRVNPRTFHPDQLALRHQPDHGSGSGT